MKNLPKKFSTSFSSAFSMPLSLSLAVLLSIFSPSTAYAEASPETMINVFERLETLEGKTRELTGENEMLKHQLEQLKKSQMQGFLNVDERLEEMDGENAKDNTAKKPAETKAPVTETPVTKPAASEKPKANEAAKVATVPSGATPEKKAKVAEAVATTVAATPAVTKKEVVAPSTEKTTKAETPKKPTRSPTSYERDTYQSAFTLMKKSPTAATKAFQEYIKMQPNSPLAANSQYWIGEIMYSHNNYKGAVQEFIKVLQKYKSSEKAPDAAIKLGYSFSALKNWAYAKRTFEDVIKYFPDNKNAVALAKKRLEKIKAAGH